LLRRINKEEGEKLLRAMFAIIQAMDVALSRMMMKPTTF
jgi:hypothetical protein